MTRILVVEDSRTQAEALRGTLAAAGFEVTVAADGAQGLEQFRAGDFDLVISDVMMPGLTGYELCRRLKEGPARRDVPVILLTALTDPADIIRGLECGADGFLTKPYQAEHLLGRVRGLLANRALRHEGKLRAGAEALFLGCKVTVPADKQQVLDLLVASFEDVIRANRELEASRAELLAAKAQVERYAARLEAQVRSSQDKYQHLMEQANDAIFVLGLDGRVREANRRAADLLGRPAAALVGARFEDLVSAATAQDVRDTWQKLQAGGAAPVADVQLVRGDRRQVPVELSGALVDAGGERVVLAIGRDLTERHRLESQVRQAQKMEAMGRLAGGVAHDFNNLLTVINGYAELILEQGPPGGVVRDLAEEIARAGDRAAALVNQLLAFSRQRGHAPAVLDLNAVVGGIITLLARLIGVDVRLQTRLSPDTGPVRADPGQVEQVLMNLAVNARDAMPTGGTLTLETGNAELGAAELRAYPGQRPGRYSVLTVRDTGVGMDEATLARAFEPFFTTKGEKGTGLGLATAYGIVHRSGGHIEVASEPGRGTTFRIYLPQVEGRAAAARSAAPPGELPHGRETVLLAEDEEAVRALARHVLRECGYTVLEAADGEEALRVAGAHPGPIHLLATDVVMPRLGGRELAERLLPQRPGTRLLYLSGYAHDPLLYQGGGAGAVAFLQKPFMPRDLAYKVRELLDR
jgi:two-component system, cell cycle sensor histidine kinase and response regulator CckA